MKIYHDLACLLILKGFLLEGYSKRCENTNYCYLPVIGFSCRISLKIGRRMLSEGYWIVTKRNNE
jgi:hypothetical protein